jgi:hypothetical protein
MTFAVPNHICEWPLCGISKKTTKNKAIASSTRNKLSRVSRQLKYWYVPVQANYFFIIFYLFIPSLPLANLLKNDRNRVSGTNKRQKEHFVRVEKTECLKYLKT